MSLDFYVRIIGKDQTGPAVSSAKKNFDRLRDAKGRFVAGAGGVGGGGRAGSSQQAKQRPGRAIEHSRSLGRQLCSSDSDFTVFGLN